MAVKDEVFWLDISVKYIVIVDVLKCLNHASNKELGDFHVKTPVVTFHVVLKSATLQQIHHQIHVRLVLEGVVKLCYEFTLDHCHKLELA